MKNVDIKDAGMALIALADILLIYQQPVLGM
jgi:hypothetical protein